MWKKQEFSIEQLPALITLIKQQLASGADAIEKMRCVYWTKGSDIIECLMPYDFIDDLETKPEIVKFILYQLID